MESFAARPYRQFLDAMAVAMITPGPVIITSGFIGYLVAGPAGAVLASLGVFPPELCLVGINRVDRASKERGIPASIQMEMAVQVPIEGPVVEQVARVGGGRSQSSRVQQFCRRAAFHDQLGTEIAGTVAVSREDLSFLRVARRPWKTGQRRTSFQGSERGRSFPSFSYLRGFPVEYRSDLTARSKRLPYRVPITLNDAAIGRVRSASLYDSVLPGRRKRQVSMRNHLSRARAMMLLVSTLVLRQVARADDELLPTLPTPVQAPSTAPELLPLPAAPPRPTSPASPAPSPGPLPPLPAMPGGVSPPADASALPPDVAMPFPPPIVVYPAYGPLGVWFDADFLLWWTKDSHVPALVTPAVPSNADAIGPANQQFLYGGGVADFGALSGGRFAVGLWLQDSQVIGLEAGYLFLQERSALLALGQEGSSDPTAEPGTFAVSLASSFQSAEVNAIANLTRSGALRFEFLAGFRFLELEERLRAAQDFISGDQSEEDLWEDVCRTRNDFYGGQIGARGEWARGRLSVGVSTKVALGVTNQQVAFNGGLTQAIGSLGTDGFGNPIETVQVGQSSNGGLLFQPVSYTRDRFTVVPEVGVNVGCQLTSYLRASLGYNFLYWSSVARAGDQATGIPKATDFWTQGLTAGLAFRF
jgi:hypothetical protein